jgi:TonB family protein
MNRLAIVLMLLPALARSQSAPAPIAPPATAAQQGQADIFDMPVGLTAPRAINRHACSQYYPMTAIRADITGATTIVFTIGTDGKVHDAVTTLPSGSSDLDQAAMTCVQTFVYTPAEYKAAPVAVTWRATVSFALDGSRPPYPVIDLVKSTACHEPPATPAATGAAVLFVAIGDDGKVTQVRTARSSGDATLDAYASSCVSRWTYKPAMNGDKPVAIRTIAIVNPNPN